ncbi:MAG: DUF2141 domain-containing protein [Flammeovirgaceae bacterium]|nr:DUF2141 domain-containing protein [Flammeovirgaceae bacterium]
MKKLSVILSLIACGLGAQSQDLEVVIKNIQNNKGSILVGLFTSKDSFMKEDFRSEKVKASGSEVIVTFRNLPKGDYAISIIHDEDENGEIDSNLFGIPKEGFGFGNDAMGTFGPPSFDKAKISFMGTKKTEVVNLRYM